MDPPASPDGTRGEGNVAEGARDEPAAAPPTRDEGRRDEDGAVRAPDGGEECEWTGQSSGEPQCYFLVHNIAKKHNVGTIARCATAFGVRSVVLIGAKSYNTFGCKGSSNHVDFVHYPTLADARVGLMERQGVTKILGVEICDGAVPIETHPFDERTAFIAGNEGDGLTKQQKAICDGFVYIRQHGPGTASLNVAVASALVVHQFALWAGYRERAREGEKFVVGERRMRTHAQTLAAVHFHRARACALVSVPACCSAPVPSALVVVTGLGEKNELL